MIQISTINGPGWWKTRSIFLVGGKLVKVFFFLVQPKNKMEFNSRLEVFFGSMFSGKTSLLLTQLTKLRSLGLNVLYVNHSNDSRGLVYSSHNVLWDNQNINITSVKVQSLTELTNEVIDSHSVIGIDEAQFFDETLLPTVLNMVEKKGKYVIVAGLISTFERSNFGHIHELIPYADAIKHLTAWCKNCCTSGLLRPALFSYCNNKPQEGTVLIGGAEVYEALCRRCYLLKQ